MDNFAREYPEQAYKVSFSSIFREIEKNKDVIKITRNYSAIRELDDYDHICWAFRNIFAYINREIFKTGVIPSKDVLPLNPEISDVMWEHAKDTYQPQDKEKMYFDSFEEREKIIDSSWKDKY